MLDEALSRAWFYEGSYCPQPPTRFQTARAWLVGIIGTQGLVRLQVGKPTWSAGSEPAASTPQHAALFGRRGDVRWLFYQARFDDWTGRSAPIYQPPTARLQGSTAQRGPLLVGKRTSDCLGFAVWSNRSILR
jgi:hypothetical protein